MAFDGLDTFATVKINDHVILEADNQFIMHRVDVTDHLQRGRECTLEIEFKSAYLEGRRIKDAHPEHTWVGFNGDMARLAVRKAQYHWGWDWGPMLSPCGPWREVRLESYHARIEDLRIDYTVEKSQNMVMGQVTAFIDGASGEAVDFEITLRGHVIAHGRAAVGSDAESTWKFELKDPELWYPHGYGDQTQYTVSATLRHGDQKLHATSRLTGFRRAELVQEPDELGKTFFFRVNGIDVFCGGSDWIPAGKFPMSH